MNNISFLDYDKITDTIMFFNQHVSFNFCVNLSRKKSSNNTIIPFHSEYKYTSEYLNRDSYSIKRNIDCYFVINDIKDYNNSVIIRPGDIIMLKMLINDLVIPWYIGNKRVFHFDNNKRLIIRGKYSKAQFPVSEYKYISFIPIILDFEDGTQKEGIRMELNSPDNYIDMDINKFFEFYYFVSETNMYNAATNMLNYVVSVPHMVNLYDMTRDHGKPNMYNANTEGYNDDRKGFFK